MLKTIYELFVNFATLAQKVEKQEQKIQDQQRELRALSMVVQQLSFELQRLKDEQTRAAEREADTRKHAAEQETAARQLFQLQIENQLLKFARRLPPASEDRPDE